MSNEKQYVDLVFHDRGKYLNLDPAAQVAVGDFGYIARKSGRFLKEGNIFKDNLVTASQIEVFKGGRVNDSTITTEGLKSLTIDATIGADILGFAASVFKARFGFEKDSGVAIVMLNSIMTRIDNQGSLKKLYEEKRLLEDRAIVTEVHACPSYTLALSSKKGSEALFGLGPAAPLVSGPGFNMKWVGKITTGELQSAHDNDGRDIYFPLFELRGIKTRGAVNELTEASEEQLPLFPTPWVLDGDGNEIDDE